MNTDIEQVDRSIAQTAAPARTSTPIRLLGWLSEVTDQPQLITLCTSVLAIGLLRKDRRLAVAGGNMLAAELLATAAKDMIKHRIDRTRPEAVQDGKGYEMRPGRSRQSDRSSFPSGHTAGAVAVAHAFADAYPAQRLAAYGVAGAIALIQIPRSKHYLSDLVAGGVIGMAAGGGIVALSKIAIDRPAPQGSSGSPGSTRSESPDGRIAIAVDATRSPATAG